MEIETKENLLFGYNVVKENVELVKQVSLLPLVRLGAPCAYYEHKVREWLADPTTGDCVKLNNYFKRCLADGKLYVY